MTQPKRYLYWYSNGEFPKIRKHENILNPYFTLEIGDIEIKLNEEQIKKLYEELDSYVKNGKKKDYSIFGDENTYPDNFVELTFVNFKNKKKT